MLSAFFFIKSQRAELPVTTRTDQDAFHKTLLERIVDMDIPLSVVENAKFGAWMSLTTFVASKLLLRDRIRNWIL